MPEWAVGAPGVAAQERGGLCGVACGVAMSRASIPPRGARRRWLEAESAPDLSRRGLRAPSGSVRIAGDVTLAPDGGERVDAASAATPHGGATAATGREGEASHSEPRLRGERPWGRVAGRDTGGAQTVVASWIRRSTVRCSGDAGRGARFPSGMLCAP
jgi:hypothetical protein